MKIDKIKKVAIVAFLLCSFSLISCNNEGINIKENVEGIKLNKGAVVENIDSVESKSVKTSPSSLTLSSIAAIVSSLA